MGHQPIGTPILAHNVLNVKVVVAAFSLEKALSRGLFRDCETSKLCEDLCPALLLLHDLMLGSDTETQQRMFMATEETDAAQIVVS